MVGKSTDIADCPVSPTDINNARVMYGLDLEGGVKKNAKKKPTMVDMERLQIPNYFHQLC